MSRAARLNGHDIVLSAQNLGKAYRLDPGPKSGIGKFVPGRLGARHEKHWALRDLTLELHRGESLGIIGENGAGKSTLLHLVCGTVQPTTGNVRLSGRAAALLELGAGFNPNFTGRENVWLNASVLGFSRAEIADRFESIAEFAGIGEFIDLPVKIYSTGMRARLAFAVSAHVDADILIIDEVLSVGDASFLQKCQRYFERFRARGTLLFVSHNTGLVARFCDRALWLEQGAMREIGQASQVCANYLASLAERDEKQQSPNRPATGNRRPLATPPLISDRRKRAGNGIEIGVFDRDAPWHGHGGARIVEAWFARSGGERTSVLAGGEEVELHVHCFAEREIERAIVGFLLRDHLGQNLFGDNTYLAYREAPPVMGAGTNFESTFRFQLPFLAPGDYTLTLAITEGSQEEHTHLHWIEEALVLSVRESPVRRGIIGCPMAEVRIEPVAAP